MVGHQNVLSHHRTARRCLDDRVRGRAPFFVLRGREEGIGSERGTRRSEAETDHASMLLMSG